MPVQNLLGNRRGGFLVAAQDQITSDREGHQSVYRDRQTQGTDESLPEMRGVISLRFFVGRRFTTNVVRHGCAGAVADRAEAARRVAEREDHRASTQGVLMKIAVAKEGDVAPRGRRHHCNHTSCAAGSVATRFFHGVKRTMLTTSLACRKTND